MLNGRISKYSQSNVLRDRMQEVGFSHGQQARVNLRGIQVEPTAESEGKIYFCKMKDIEVTEILEKGDGGPLPNQAIVDNLVFPDKGTHDLSNVILSSNGSLRVEADAKTKVDQQRWYHTLFSVFS